MSDTHPFYKLSELIGHYNTDRNSLDIKQLQDLRENIALNLFLMSDSAAKAISNFDAKEYERRRFYAEREEFYRNDIDERTGKNFNVADSERKARLDAKQIDDETIEALRQKEKVRIILNAVNQILNSIAARTGQLNKNV
jgi:hypothetical protein